MTVKNQKNAAADRRQQQNERLKLKRAIAKYGIPSEVYIDCPAGSQKGAQ